MDFCFADLVNAFTGSGSVALAGGSDVTMYNPPLRRIYVGGTGDVKVDTPSGVGLTYKAVPQGTYLTVRATKVYQTGTTATLLVGES